MCFSQVFFFKCIFASSYSFTVYCGTLNIFWFWIAKMQVNLKFYSPCDKFKSMRRCQKVFSCLTGLMWRYCPLGSLWRWTLIQMLSKVGFVLACTALAAGDRLCENITCSVKARSTKTFSDSLTKFSYETCTFLDDDLSCKHATERLLKRGRESRRSGCKENLPELKHIADDVCKQSMHAEL